MKIIDTLQVEISLPLNICENNDFMISEYASMKDVIAKTERYLPLFLAQEAMATVQEDNHSFQDVDVHL